jgi:hypothetical protein
MKLKTTLLFGIALITSISLQATKYQASLDFNTSSLLVTLDSETNKVTIDLSGDEKDWVAVGFGSQTMNGTYCVVVNEGGEQNVHERNLAARGIGTKQVTDLFSTDSYTEGTSLTKFNYTITRDLIASTTENSAYDFVAEAGEVDFIIAYGDVFGSYHSSRMFGKLNFVEINVTSVNKIAKQSVKVFPNPAVNSVSVSLDQANVNLEVSILDLHGRLISTEIFTNSEMVTMNTADLAAGSYLVKIKGDSFTSSSVLVKK